MTRDRFDMAPPASRRQAAQRRRLRRLNAVRATAGHKGAGRGRTQSGIAPVQGPNPVSGAWYKRLFAVGGHSALCISIHRRYKVFGPGESHTRYGVFLAG
jgi:hypothetical protein